MINIPLNTKLDMSFIEALEKEVAGLKETILKRNENRARLQILKQNNNGLLKLLTRRQVEILKLYCEGYTKEQVAEKLKISDKTLKNHQGAIYKRLQVNNLTQATLYVIKHDIINL